VHGIPEHAVASTHTRQPSDNPDADALAAALKPFAEACRRVNAQYDTLADEHGDSAVRRPSPDALVYSFSYDTLLVALNAYDKYSAGTGFPADVGGDVLWLPIHADRDAGPGEPRDLRT